MTFLACLHFNYNKFNELISSLSNIYDSKRGNKEIFNLVTKPMYLLLAGMVCQAAAAGRGSRGRSSPCTGRDAGHWPVAIATPPTVLAPPEARCSA